MSLKEKVKSTVEAAKKSILGVFEGECADSTITNKNGLDITGDVWRVLFASDDYKEGIEKGWYIGFLGHPEDVGCQEFQHGCIVMKEGHIDENGKVYGKFDLLDTPVGRIVKTFIDAGVKFGISVRGAGDIISNSVDPDTFVFRGFDLVTFPAFPESVPTFTAIAASTDADKRKKYEVVCKAVKDNLKDITSATTIDLIQSQFAPQSEEYAALEARKAELTDDYDTGLAEVTPEDLLDAPIVPNDSDEEVDLTEAKLAAVTDLFIEQLERNHELEEENEALRVELQQANVESSRKIQSMKRITASQITASQRAAEEAQIRCEQSEKAHAATQAQLRSITASFNTSQSEVSTLRTKLSESERSNLTYQRKIEASTKALKDTDDIISGLRKELRETVTASTDAKTRASNLDAENRRLSNNLAKLQKVVREYQQAYARIYANAIGVDLGKLPIEASTSVSQLQKLVGGTNTCNILSAPAVDMLELLDEDEADIVTL